MNKAEVCALIKEIAIIPAIRVSTAEEAHFAVEAIASGGIPIVEITLTVSGAVELISHLVRFHPKMIVGAGTVLNTDLATKCLDAGVSFLTSPGRNMKVIEFALKREMAVLPGALTPTEVIEAWKTGADFVKIFPCGPLGGPAYIRASKLPFPQVPLIATGGVNQQTAGNFIRNGATALGIGAELINPEGLPLMREEQIRELARRYLAMVKAARAPQNGG